MKKYSSNVIVIGAGVIGVVTSWYLLRRGFSVTLIDKNQYPASEASYANAGLLAPSDSFAWASPTAPWTFFKSLFHKEWGVRIVPRADKALWLWYLKFLRECSKGRYKKNTRIKLDLAMYSLSCLNDIVKSTGIQFEQASNGIIYLYRTVEELENAKGNFQYLSDLGLPIKVLSREEVFKQIPEIQDSYSELAGGIYSTACNTGDCRQFTRSLFALCEKDSNFTFKPSEEAVNLNVDINGNIKSIKSIKTNKGEYECDSLVIAAGCKSREIAKMVNINLPILPVKGYSATFPIKKGLDITNIGIEDTNKFMAYNRLGGNMRISCFAEFGALESKVVELSSGYYALKKGAQRLFPNMLNIEQSEHVERFRPMTPTTVPFVGRIKYENLYLNTGHGHLGWTLACGSSNLIVEEIFGEVQKLSRKLSNYLPN